MASDTDVMVQFRLDEDLASRLDAEIERATKADPRGTYNRSSVMRGYLIRGLEEDQKRAASGG